MPIHPDFREPCRGLKYGKDLRVVDPPKSRLVWRRVRKFSRLGHPRCGFRSMSPAIAGRLARAACNSLRDESDRGLSAEAGVVANLWRRSTALIQIRFKAAVKASAASSYCLS